MNKVVISMNMDKFEIGKRIMRLRKEQGYTQENLAEILQISKNHLSGIECGKYTATTPFIFKLCTIFEKTPDYFLIGQVTSSTDELTSLVRGLSESEQKIAIELLKTYINARVDCTSTFFD